MTWVESLKVCVFVAFGCLVCELICCTRPSLLLLFLPNKRNWMEVVLVLILLLQKCCEREPDVERAAAVCPLNNSQRAMKTSSVCVQGTLCCFTSDVRYSSLNQMATFAIQIVNEE